MATSTRYENLDLDPGTVPSRKRRTSGCKCMLIAVGVLITLLVSIDIAKFASSTFKGMREPHNALYENKTLSEVKNMSTIVRPLVDRDQKFDIVATVWVRTLDSPDSAVKLHHWMHGEEHIFSGTVFRGVTLMSEHVHEQVNLSIPLETFSKANILENFDIRATFKVVPQSPSLLDHITGFTSWAPTTIVFPDITPEGRARKLEGHSDSSPPETLEDLQNAALESFAVSTPLIDLHPINSTCGQTSVEEAEDAGAIDPLAAIISTKGFPPLESHPYVITRTDLRLVRMDKIYNKKAFDSHHNQLRWNDETNGCIGTGGDSRDGRRCHRQFDDRANCETRIELGIPDEKTGVAQKQVAYAPYLSVNRRSWGPLDVIPMPVNRERCPEGSVPETPQFMNVTWNLAYSGSTAEKLLLSKMIADANTYNTTDTEFKKVEAQQFAEVLQRIHGHKHSLNNYTGRMLIVSTIGTLLKFVHVNLQFHYWYTRSTTVGISIIGSSLAALAYTLLFGRDLWALKAFREGQPFLSSLLAVVMAVYCHLLTPSVILRAVLRLEGTDRFPYLMFMPASHLERASARLETKGRKWRKWWIIGILIGAFTLNFFDTLRELPLISRIGPTPDPDPVEFAIPNSIKNYLVNPLFLSANILQQVLNYRSKTFAGGYHLAAWMHVGVLLARLVAHVPKLAWRAGGIRDPLSLEELVKLGLAISFAVQGVVYRRVEQDIEDKDTN